MILDWMPMKRLCISFFTAFMVLTMVIDLGSVRRSLVAAGFGTADLMFISSATGANARLPLPASEPAGTASHMARPHLPRLLALATTRLLPPRPSTAVCIPDALLPMALLSPATDIFHPPV
jgi:hypothetical protein